ncbi:hypothetical protein L3Y34_000252 [Caenorhabditis briggsae]|uniref:Zinc finger C3HC4 RING-type domain-containing protein n=1 Tax=Caenorhabditis briggsae TaxID=6238 RepID=A0AAE9IN99_CAEBR|nr:hypothetical protein L3Y34_000252 [Caenorhabditis briggsae]
MNLFLLESLLRLIRLEKQSISMDQDKLYETVRIVKRQLGCSHTVCRECVLKHGGNDWRCCPFCKLTGIINGKASKKEKQKAREDLKNAIQKF